MLRTASSLRLSVNKTISRRNLHNLRIGVKREIAGVEKRVALTPSNVSELSEKGARVHIEKGAGNESGFTDGMYETAGATIVNDIYQDADVNTLVMINPPSVSEAEKIGDRTVLGMMFARTNTDLVDYLSEVLKSKEGEVETQSN